MPQGADVRSRIGFIAVIILGIASIWAQQPPQLQQPSKSRTVTVRGEIVSSTPIIGTLTVELGPSGAGQSAYVNSDHTFELDSVTPGTQELRVIGNNGQILHQEYVSVSGSNATLSIHLPDQKSNNGSPDSSVSLQQLRHKVPAAAQKAFDKGEHAAAKGRLEEARNYFQEALTLDPEFADAHNELGAAEAGLQQLPEAATEFQKAIDLVPEHRLALPNLSIVLAKMRRFHEAGEVARRALKVAPSASNLHYILAVSLLADHADVQETIFHFERATPDIPAAHLTLAELLVQCGRTEDAIRHLKEFLDNGAPDDKLRAKVEARIAELRK